tara:strand:- start:5094 stop:5207 length:114 start_codon:yes stop_codon:yes gene_type:complete
MDPFIGIFYCPSLLEPSKQEGFLPGDNFNGFERRIQL